MGLCVSKKPDIDFNKFLESNGVDRSWILLSSFRDDCIVVFTKFEHFTPVRKLLSNRKWSGRSIQVLYAEPL